LSDPNYGYLTHAQRSTLHGLWLLYARSHRQIPDDTAWITRQLGVRVTRATLEALNHAGFIRFSASKMLAIRARTRETETEEPLEAEREDPKAKDLKNDDEEPLEANASAVHDDEPFDFDFNQIDYQPRGMR
jgi:hypothetical protein